MVRWRGLVLLCITIGMFSIISAVAGVINDMPDYCILVGGPVKAIKKYDI